MLRSLLTSLLSDVHYTAISVALATVIWLYVQSEETHQTVLQAEVIWNLPDGLSPTEKLPQVVGILVEGSRSATRRASREQLEVSVDATTLQKGTQVIDMATNATVSGLPNAIRLVSVTPPVVNTDFDVTEIRKLKVVPELIGEPATGFVTVSKTATPDRVVVSGPRSVLQDLRTLRTTPVDISGMSREYSILATVDVPPGLTTVDPETVTVNVETVAINKEKTFAAVPVHVWDAAGWVVEPATVSVQISGPTNIIQDIGLEDVTAFAHIAPKTNGSVQVSYGPISGDRLRILHTGGADAVQVLTVSPDTVTVRRR